jgi:WD40 repeat protein
MVVAALFEQIVPSHRGLTRDETLVGGAVRDDDDGHDEDDDRVWKYQAPTMERTATPHATGPETARFQRTTAVPRQATRQRRKRCKATKCLTSLAADVDVITDWIFYFHCRYEDQEYRAEYQENPDGEKSPYLIPPAMMSLIFVVCVLGTCLWMILATDGKLATPLLRIMGYDKLSMGYVLFLSVVVEDVPQVILTFLVEDYFKENGHFNNYALINVIASLYDTLIKLAEAFDERADVVETGIWCKDSIWAHNKKVMCVLPLPILEDDDDVNLPAASLRGSRMGSRNRFSSTRIHVDNGRTTTRQSLLQEARGIVSETKLPRLRFLSASKDQTVRLWDTESRSAGFKRNKCVQKFKGHSGSVSCMAIVNFPRQCQRNLSGHIGPDDESVIHTVHGDGISFLTGSHDGTIKLWDTESSDAHRTFHIAANDSVVVNDSVKVTCIAYLGNDPTAMFSSSNMRFHQSNNDHLFASGYESGKVRIWDLTTGMCLSEFEAHNGKVHAMCRVKNASQFATAGADAMVKVWSFSTDKNVSDGSSVVINDPDHVLVGHTGPVLSVTSVSRQVLLTGSEDCTARVWSLADGSCLRIFVGHSQAVTTVAVVDPITFLTGSKDTTIKVWDGLSASCIRTYTGHSGTVTSVSTTFQSGTFISASEDQTVKLWIFTAVLPVINTDDGGTLSELLGIEDTFACMTCQNNNTDGGNIV